MIRVFYLLFALLTVLSSAQNPVKGNFRTLPDSTDKALRFLHTEAGWMTDATEIGKLLETPGNWKPEARQYTMGTARWTEGNLWQGLADSAFAGKPALIHQGAFWLPLPASLAALQAVSGKTLAFDSTQMRITAQGQKDLLSVQLSAMDNGELLEIRLARKVRVEKFFNSPHFIVRIEDITIDTLLFADITSKSGQISRLIPIQDKKTAQITLQLRNNNETPELIQRDNGKTLQIILRKKSPPAKGKSSSSAAPSSSSRKLRTIVLDPGHGGKDPGAVGYQGLQEKKVVLQVAQLMEKKLKAKGFEVRLTRNDDSFVDLSERPAMASKWGGDLFISLHCNAVDGAERQKRTEGFKFYILREAESEEDKAIARRENKAIELSANKKGKNEISPVEWILLENQLNLYTRESERFTGFLVDAYEGGQIKKMSSGAGQAGFMVLVGAFMPAVLVEIGFITHPEDAKWMSSNKGQDDIAARLVNAITAYGKALGD